jgi:protein gp37
MGDTTGISWTDKTFNPRIGCARVSLGCVNCYADDQSSRFGNFGESSPLWRRHGPRHVTSGAYWRKPLAWDRQAAAQGRQHKVFCASLADVFEDHPDLDEPRARLWALIEQTPHLTWQLLTKRQQNVAAMVLWGEHWPPNVWPGTSVEGQRWADERIPVLAGVPAAVRFLSVEPLTEPVRLDLSAIGWVILGGMSGPKYRQHQLRPEWARSVCDQCAAAGVAFFFKQWGGLRPKDGGKVPDGRERCDFPRRVAP